LKVRDPIAFGRKRQRFLRANGHEILLAEHAPSSAKTSCRPGHKHPSPTRRLVNFPVTARPSGHGGLDEG
jgi:hypothetical protein